MKGRSKLRFILAALFVFVLTTSGSVFASGNHYVASNCPIPQRGPWPPCATGGRSTNAWQLQGSRASVSHSGCVVPATGAWPACATGGVYRVAAPAPVYVAPANTGCAIPYSGPWPTCATGGVYRAAAPAHNSSVDSNVHRLQHLLEQMGGMFDRGYHGTTAECNEFVGYYLGISALPVYHNLSAGQQGSQATYVRAAIRALDTNKDIFLLCRSGGGLPSAHNATIARTGIADSLNTLHVVANAHSTTHANGALGLAHHSASGVTALRLTSGMHRIGDVIYIAPH